MAATCHTVRDDCRKKAFDSAQQREGKGCWKNLHLREGQLWNFWRRKCARDTPEPRANSLNRQAENPGEQYGEADRDQKRGPMRSKSAERHDGAGRDRRNADCAIFVEGIASARATSLGMSGPGSLAAMVSPKSSFIWLAK